MRLWLSRGCIAFVFLAYAVALWHPVRHRLSLWEAVVMQAIGVIGETLITASLPDGHPVLHSALERFIEFDGLGLLLLLLAVWFCRPAHKQIRG